MPATERSLWKLLKQNLPKKTHCERIENRSGEGMPDVYLCIDGVPVWLELKIVKNGRVKVSKSQIAWHCSHSRCGGVSFFLLNDPSTSDLFLFDGASVIEISGSRIDDLRPASSMLRPATCDLRPRSYDIGIKKIPCHPIGWQGIRGNPSVGNR